MDPIDRDAALKELRALEDGAEIIPYPDAREYAILILQDAQKRLLKLPSLEHETAHWIKHETQNGFIVFWECSRCGKYSMESGNYCPNCGSIMLGTVKNAAEVKQNA